MTISALALILGITLIIAYILHRIRQPLIISYIIAGILLGPQVLNLIQDHHSLELFSQAGIIFLLFIVGLHLNPKVLREVGRISIITGIGQILFTTLFGYLLVRLIGLDHITAIFTSIALTFSSTIIIMKLLADKKELNQLHAKIAIGFLLVQDLAAAAILIFMPIFSPQQDVNINPLLQVSGITSIAILITLGIFVLSKYLLNPLMNSIANSTELIFLTAITWGIAIASLFSLAGLSVEVGALIAGIALSTSDYASEIASRLKPLRDFFLIIFFILLGSHFNLGQLSSVLIPALILSAFVLIGNPLIVYILLRTQHYPRVVSFKAGLTVAQISEFSLILIASATTLYTLSPITGPLITLVGLITIGASTYMIQYSDQLYHLVLPLLKKLPLISPIKSTTKAYRKKIVYVFGSGPHQENITDLLLHPDYKLVVVDYDPETRDAGAKKGVEYIFGDASDIEFLESLSWQRAHAVITFISNTDTANLIIKHASQNAPKHTKIIAITPLSSHVNTYSESGAHHIFLPYHLTTKKIKRLL